MSGIANAPIDIVDFNPGMINLPKIEVKAILQHDLSEKDQAKRNLLYNLAFNNHFVIEKPILIMLCEYYNIEPYYLNNDANDHKDNISRDLPPFNSYQLNILRKHKQIKHNYHTLFNILNTKNHEYTDLRINDFTNLQLNFIREITEHYLEENNILDRLQLQFNKNQQLIQEISQEFKLINDQITQFMAIPSSPNPNELAKQLQYQNQLQEKWQEYYENLRKLQGFQFNNIITKDILKSITSKEKNHFSSYQRAQFAVQYDDIEKSQQISVPSTIVPSQKTIGILGNGNRQQFKDFSMFNEYLLGSKELKKDLILDEYINQLVKLESEFRKSLNKGLTRDNYQFVQRFLIKENFENGLKKQELFTGYLVFDDRYRHGPALVTTQWLNPKNIVVKQESQMRIYRMRKV